MNEKEAGKYLLSLSNSQGSQKMKNYINEIFLSKSFQEWAKTIRKKYDIPENGFHVDEDSYTFPPQAWNIEGNLELKKEFSKEMKKVSKKYNIHLLDGINIFENYIFYKNTEYSYDSHGLGMCITDDVILRKEEPYIQEIEEQDDYQYPIAIRISPYASLRDILDYVQRVYKYDISGMQNKYKKDEVRLGKVRKKNDFIRRRNDFIYKNKDLPRKEIMSLLGSEFGREKIIDVGLIGKIISEEKKIRE
jgi:hypothetical protein